MPWPLGKPRDPATNAKVGRPGRKHPEDCAHCAALRGKPSGNARKYKSTNVDTEYKRIHNRVRQVRGNPTACTECGTGDKLDWALNHDEPSDSFRVLADGRRVSDDPYDYIPLCRTHHNRFDHRKAQE